jgi:hypothetical protein
MYQRLAVVGIALVDVYVCENEDAGIAGAGAGARNQNQG